MESAVPYNKERYDTDPIYKALVCEKRNAAAHKRRSDPEYREKQRAYKRNYYANHPEARLAKSAAEVERVRNLMADPEYAAKHRQRMRNFWAYQRRYRLTNPWGKIIQGIRCRCKKAGIACDLNAAWARSVWTGKCEITGIAFDTNYGARTKNAPIPFSPSVDRIDPTKGYTTDNVRWVLFGVNALKGMGSDDDMMMIAEAIVKAAKG